MKTYLVENKGSKNKAFAVPGGFKTVRAGEISEIETDREYTQGLVQKLENDKCIVTDMSSEEAVDEAVSEVMSGLREEAERLGIKVDKRWSEDTLIAKIEEAENGNSEEQ